jgi:hypothetical protein
MGAPASGMIVHSLKLGPIPEIRAETHRRMATILPHPQRTRHMSNKALISVHVYLGSSSSSMRAAATADGRPKESPQSP